MPPVGKYNAGQKLVFWAFGVSLLLLLVTGFVFWRPWFADFFPILAAAHRGAGACGRRRSC